VITQSAYIFLYGTTILAAMMAISSLPRPKFLRNK
jgi:hypothetical protein